MGRCGNRRPYSGPQLRQRDNIRRVGNYGVMNASLSRESFFAYDTPSLRIAAVVRNPVPNELGEAMWFRVVDSNGGESSVSYKRTGLLLFAGNHSVEDEP